MAVVQATGNSCQQFLFFYVMIEMINNEGIVEYYFIFFFNLKYIFHTS